MITKKTMLPIQPLSEPQGEKKPLSGESTSPTSENQPSQVAPIVAPAIVPAAPESTPEPHASPIAEAAEATKEEIGLYKILVGTFKVVKSRFWLFMSGTILNFILLFLLYLVGMPVALIAGASLGKYGMFAGFVLIGLATLMLSYLFYGSMANQAATTIRGEAVPFGESLSAISKKVGTFLHLCFKIFVYSKLWVVLLILVIYAVVGILSSSIGMSTVLIIYYVLGLMGLAVIPYAMIRFLRVILAIPVLVAYPTISAEEALLAGLEMTKNRWWLTFSFITVFGFLMAIIPSGVNALASLTGSSAIQILSVIAAVFFGILSYTASISFFQVMVSQFGDKAKTIKLNIGVLIGAIVITLLPIILAVAMPLLGIMAFNKVINNAENTPFAMDEMGEAPAIYVRTAENDFEPASFFDNPAGQTETKPRLPKLPGSTSAESSDSGVSQKVFDDLFAVVFERKIWADYYPMFAQDEKTALDYAVKLTSSGARPADRAKPMFSPFKKILNYLGKSMYDYKKIDEKIGDSHAFYLYTAMAGSSSDPENPARYEDLFCYPYVKEEGEWKMKNARFIPKGSYDNMNLSDSNIMKVCEDFIKPQPTLTDNEVMKRFSLEYQSNLSFDIYLNGHLIGAHNIDFTRPLDGGAGLKFPIQKGVNSIIVKTGPFDRSKIDQANSAITLVDEYDITDLSGIDIDSVQPEEGYTINGKSTSGDKITSVTLTKEIGKVVLGANEERTLEFNYDTGTGRLTAL